MSISYHKILFKFAKVLWKFCSEYVSWHYLKCKIKLKEKVFLDKNSCESCINLKIVSNENKIANYLVIERGFFAVVSLYLLLFFSECSK